MPDPSTPAPDSPLPLTFATKQERSRRTLDRLLDAAEASLAERGVEGTTVPAIAERAEMSVGVVYRRFRDKDALLRAVYERFFERTAAGNRAALASDYWDHRGAAEIIAVIIRGMVHAHAIYRGLLRALFAYAHTHADPAFRARVDALNRGAVDRVAALLLARRAEIAHPDPERAVGLALLVVASALNRWVQVDGETLFPYRDADDLTRELTSMVTSYLGIGAPH